MKKRKSVFVSKCKIWKLRKPCLQEKFNKAVRGRYEARGMSGGNVETEWKEVKDCLLEVANDVCGKTKGLARHRDSWWWNEEVADVVKEKRRLYIAMKNSKDGADVLQAKRDALAYNIGKRKCNKVISMAKEVARRKLQ